MIHRGKEDTYCVTLQKGKHQKHWSILHKCIKGYDDCKIGNAYETMQHLQGQIEELIIGVIVI